MNHVESSSSRHFVFALLITLAAGTAAGRIASALRVYEPDLAKVESDPTDRRGPWPDLKPRPMPTFGSNDRSRWATVRALVDEGTFVIGRRDPVLGDSGIVFEDGWTSIDKVLNPKTLEYYSSKPPLLSTLVAGLYWLLQMTFGWTLKDDPFTVVRTTLLVVNLIPFIVYLWILTRLVDRYAASDWARYFVLGVAAFGTLVTPFLITLNNHTVATFCVVFALYPVFSLLRFPLRPRSAEAQPAPWAFVLSGLFASFTVCNELPAAAWAAALGAVLLLTAPRRTLLFFVPAALIPLGAQLGLNYLALGELGPAYGKFGTEWYEYEGSHWRKPAAGQVDYGIDWAWMHESNADYAMNVLVGHHGLFSLSPIWLLAFAGVLWAAWRLRGRQAYTAHGDQEPQADLSLIAGLTFLVTAVVVGFYVFGTAEATHNYGGWTSGLRWLMWLTPLWLLTMLPVVDWLGQRRWGRWLALALLAWSVFSVSYRPWNPWRHPWLYDVLDSGGYIPYGR